jgi:hypothetical protein
LYTSHSYANASSQNNLNERNTRAKYFVCFLFYFLQFTQNQIFDICKLVKLTCQILFIIHFTLFQPNNSTYKMNSLFYLSLPLFFVSLCSVVEAQTQDACALDYYENNVVSAYNNTQYPFQNVFLWQYGNYLLTPFAVIPLTPHTTPHLHSHSSFHSHP